MPPALATVRFLVEAQEELWAAHEWYRLRSPTAARRFVRDIRRAVALIAASPRTWPVVRRNTRRYGLKRFPFSIATESRARACASWRSRTRSAAMDIGAIGSESHAAPNSVLPQSPSRLVGTGRAALGAVCQRQLRGGPGARTTYGVRRRVSLRHTRSERG